MNNFKVWLSIVVGVVVLGGSISYMALGNYINEAKASEEIANKKVVTFQDLPLDVQKNYIHKDDLKSLEELGILQQGGSKELVVQVDAPIEGDVDELKAQIMTLRQKNSFLYQDNIDLANKNWDLALKLSDEQKALEEERQKLITQNLETMNEAEQQHYQNINDLTRRINTLQEESMKSSKEYELKIVSLENAIHNLEKELRQKSLAVSEEVTEATKEQRISNSTLVEKNRYLMEQLKVLEETMGAQLDEKEERFQAQKAQIERLRSSLQEKEAEQNNLLTKHTKEILNLERKHNDAIQKIISEQTQDKQALQASVSQKNDEIASLMSEHNKKLEQMREEIIVLEGKLRQEGLNNKKLLTNHEEALRSMQDIIEKLKTKNRALEERNVKIQEQMDDMLRQKNKEYAAALEDIKAHSLQKGDRENVQITSLEKELEFAKEELAKNEKTILQLEQELSSANAQMKKAQEDAQKVLSENEAKHAKNYEHLNEKIVSLERDRANLIAKTTEHIDGLNEQLAKEKKNLEEKLGALESKYNQSQKEIASLKLGQDEQLLALKDEFESLRKTFKDREETYETKIAQLTEALEREQQESQVLAQNSKPQKPKLIASLTCDDMESGTNTPTLTCKARVEEFLRDFEPTHFFEVVPIVDDGGFATLKRVESSKLGVPSDEIKRLTRLSNLGLGKDRAASGGVLIDSHFEGLARISYAVEGVEMHNKRGFIIKVYR